MVMYSYIHAHEAQAIQQSIPPISLSIPSTRALAIGFVCELATSLLPFNILQQPRYPGPASRTSFDSSVQVPCKVFDQLTEQSQQKELVGASSSMHGYAFLHVCAQAARCYLQYLLGCGAFKIKLRAAGWPSTSARCAPMVLTIMAFHLLSSCSSLQLPPMG